MAGGEGLPWVWGVPVELAGLPTPKVAPGSRLAVRAVAMEAPREVGFLWLCQMRRAPYSYDWLDNFGRRSPRRADPSLTDLAVGQSFMTIFELTDFTDGESLMLRMKDGRPTRIFGAITLHYRVETITESRSRLVAAMWMPPVGRLLGKPMRYLLAWGDLLMMRKQLRTLAALAERDADAGRGSEGGR